MKEKQIAIGAEATISLSENKITKKRIKKSYRYPDLDKKIRLRRTKAEAKILSKASKIIPVPKILEVDEKSCKIILEHIKGKKLSEHLEKIPNKKKAYNQIGKNAALLHNSGLIHGDLTTSNMILGNSEKSPTISKNQKVYFIDFGLGFHSDKAEDKAVDLHLIKEALEAKHPSLYKTAFRTIINSYKKHSKNSLQVLTRLEKVEKRGRYKAQY